MKNNVISIGLGITIGLVVGVGSTWYLTNDFINQATIEAEFKFNELLEQEKSKYSTQISSLEKTKENLEYTLTFTKITIDSLNTTINTRSKELNKIKRKYYEELSNIDGMSHNELTDFFAKRYKY